jgi:hypothetical protein
MKETWQLDCSKFCDNIITENGIIVDCMPLLTKFKNQPIGNLINWSEKLFGNVTVQRVE